MRPSTRLFHVGDTKSEHAEAQSKRQPLPSIDLDLSGDEGAAPPGVTGEAWHKARGWASED